MMYCIGIGSNDVQQSRYVEQAIEAISQFVMVTKRSSCYRSPAWPDARGAAYLNCAIVAETEQTPRQLLDFLLDIEKDLGRKRQERWGGRTIDLDILACGDLILPDLTTWHQQASLTIDQARLIFNPPLTIPHPRLCARAFALLPLVDVMPDWVHPVYKETSSILVQHLSQDQRESTHHCNKG